MSTSKPLVYIVAGGASLKNFDWADLKYDPVIAINNAAFHLPYAQHVYFANKDWFDMHRLRLRAHSGQVHQGWAPGDEKNYIEESWIRRWYFTGSKDYDPRPRCLTTGVCSGNAALTLAVHLGYKDLHLYGYDMNHAGNFHSDHIWTDHQPLAWAVHYEHLVEQLKKEGVTVTRHP
jgi:hypothetical protein